LSKNLVLKDKKVVYKSKIPKFIKKINLTSITEEEKENIHIYQPNTISAKCNIKTEKSIKIIPNMSKNEKEQSTLNDRELKPVENFQISCHLKLIIIILIQNLIYQEDTL
jgi:hypothetical protein